MVTPGLLPEADDRRPHPLRWTLAILALLFAALIATAAALIVRLKEQRDRAYARIDELAAELRKPAPLPSPAAAAPPAAPAILPVPTTIEPSGARIEVRVVPAPSEASLERIQAGTEEFRAGRYDRAELQFLRAVPDAYLHLLLTGLARSEWREAHAFLVRAAAADPLWFRKLVPRDLFGSAAELARVIEALEARVRENPLDGQAKTLLAYLLYHEKGAAYAKGLLVEVTVAQPDNAEARAFLEGLDK